MYQDQLDLRALSTAILKEDLLLGDVTERILPSPNPAQVDPSMSHPSRTFVPMVNGDDSGSKRTAPAVGLRVDAVEASGVDALGAAGLSHPSRTFVPMKGGGDGSGSERMAVASALCVDAVDVAALCDDGLRARLGVLGRAESRLAAMKADVLGELARRRGAADAEHAAKEALSVSGRAARSDVKDAVALGELELT